jgi:hypothetical protein
MLWKVVHGNVLLPDSDLHMITSENNVVHPNRINLGNIIDKREPILDRLLIKPIHI